MLAAWGSSCGSCRPGVSAPKTLGLSAVGQPSPTPGLSLGFLVVLHSPDEKRVGSLIQLTAPTSVLSRGVRNPAADEEWFDFSDEFMSCGNALVYRPAATTARKPLASGTASILARRPMAPLSIPTNSGAARL